MESGGAAGRLRSGRLRTGPGLRNVAPAREASAAGSPPIAGGPCKVCRKPSRFFCNRDFADSCEDRRARVFPPCGVSVSYVACGSCGFLFTRHFDELTDAEMGRRIYNEEYIRVDPDFARERPDYISRIIAGNLSGMKAEIFNLDYGGGAGRLSELLVAQGFAGSDVYDPHFSDAPVPSRRYELVTAFEVVEHSRDPLGTFRDAMSFLEEDGALLFSTQLAGRGTAPDWWYIAPRNGHVSLHTERSLRHLARECGAAYLPLGAGLHLFYRNPRNRIVQAFARRHAQAILYGASRLGMSALVHARARLSEAGVPRTAPFLRHAARAMLTPLGIRRRSFPPPFRASPSRESGAA